MFKMLTNGRTTDGRRSDWYTISSPMSLLLRLAKKAHHQNDRNGQPLTFYIELCMKSIGVGLDLALQKFN